VVCGICVCVMCLSVCGSECVVCVFVSCVCVSGMFVVSV
jgi:hypothetical protein